MSNENSTLEIVGRKIFFIHPTTSVKNQVVAELVQQEFEVYVSKNPARLAKAMKKFPDSIIFANIDEGMSALEWERWIGDILTDLPKINVGVFSSNNDEEFQEKYINKNRITCGFMTLKVDMSKTAEKLLEVLEKMKAKGRRKYLRTTTEREANAVMNMPFNGDFINGTIKDISVVGFSCVFNNAADLQKNSIHKDIQIKLQSVLLKVEAVIYGSREASDEKIYVMLFTQRVDPDIRIKIRKYIQNNLQSKMDSEIN
jgi:hypothetical protein